MGIFLLVVSSTLVGVFLGVEPISASMDFSQVKGKFLLFLTCIYIQFVLVQLVIISSNYPLI